ncbi:MFS transporter [Actinoallomurus soli]|uniref:MFS transporter n=1 Tax=Actinoallomurus soli TaxID=2952535 RepID=UPI002092219C|nr:MFS transporter [Actinoallomurus soli]MCO5969475.1 MFS transporter [Actinoallomurus soli]
MAVLEEIAGRTAVRPRMTARQRLVLVLLLGAQFMLAVDFSILNVALPAVGDGLGFGLHALQWVASGFALPAAGLTLLSGRVADLFGRRRMFLAGMALLAAGSLVGGLAAGPAMLLTGRVLQGVATAISTPAALSLLTTAFPEGPLRDRALGLNGALMSAGFTAGAVLGGVLTDLLSWRWAFLVNVPIALAILAGTPKLVPGGRAPEGARLDVPGALTVTGGLLALVYGVTAAGERGWTAPVTLAAFAVAVALLVAFWFVEVRAAAPLVPVGILRRRTVVWGNAAGLIAFLTETSLVFLMTLYLQEVLGYSPLVTGLAFGVLGAGTVAGGLLGARTIARLGAYRILVGAFVLQAAATASLAALGDGHRWILLFLAATFAGGVGNMLAIVAFMVTATSGLPDAEQGLATGLATMTQQIGITLGIPIMSAIAAARTSVLGGPHAEAVLGGVRLAVLVNAAIVVAGALLAALFLGRRAAGRR